MLWIYIWLGVVALSLILEFVTMELVSIWVSVGALVSLILAACNVGYEIQIIVCVAISIACILGLRKITLKFLNRNNEKTNTELLIGTRVKLLSDITSDEMGSIKHNGVVWSAVSADGSEIKKDEFVIIQQIEGNKLIVKKEKSEE